MYQKPDPQPEFLRRRDAGDYLRQRFGIASPALLAKLASIGGGPAFHRHGTTVLYKPTELDRWARERISGPVASTAAVRDAAIEADE